MRSSPPVNVQTAPRLTWDQICARHPDRWVVLVDIDWIDEDGNFRTAIVLGEATARDESLRQAEPVKAGYSEFAHCYTGRIRAPIYPVNLALA